MKIKTMILLAGMILLFGCGREKKQEVIPKKDFIPILVDIHLMDGMLSKGNIREKIIQSDTADYYQALLRHHGYTKAQFDSSVLYYSRDLKRFDRIYQQVIARLNRMETQAHEEMKQEKQNKAEEEKQEGDTAKTKDKVKEKMLERQ